MTVEDCRLGQGVVIYQPDLVNLYGCEIGDFTTVAPFVEIQRGAVVGRNCKISSHAFLCAHVTLGDGVFVGHGVMFTNDAYPVIGRGVVLRPTQIEDGVSIGSGATILPVRVGQGSVIGAGAVVTRDVPAWCIVVGNPGRVLRQFANRESRDRYIAEREAYASRNRRIAVS
jgi:acetyltransferase-like isoleucine patch superfamily enzyme